MLRFFRQIRQRLLTENRVSKYLLYAFGEILLVMIGILLALQVNNWNEWRKNQEALEGYLIFLLEDLESDKIQLIQLIREREESMLTTTKIINTYKKKSPIYRSEFLDAFNHIVIEQKFDNNTNGFDKVQNSILFDSYGFQRVRNLIRDYQKQIDKVQFLESKQNTSSENMESELLRNGFYDSNWDDFRAYYLQKEFQANNDSTDYTKEINRYPEVKAIFMRNEWVIPFIINDYESIIATGEKLKTEIRKFLN